MMYSFFKKTKIWSTFLFLTLTIPLKSEEHRKILCLTVPKAGTHLLQKAIQAIIGESLQWIQGDMMENPAIQDQLFHSDEKVYIAHLFPSTDTIRSFDSSRFIKILLIRDPRDVMVSFQSHLARKWTWPFGGRDYPSMDTTSLDEQMHYALMFPSFSPKDSLLCAALWLKDPNLSDLLVIRFEDLVGVQGGGDPFVQQLTLYSLAHHLGYPLSWEKIGLIASRLFGSTKTFNKGQISAWQESYSPENKSLFNEILGQTMIDFGYETSLYW